MICSACARRGLRACSHEADWRLDVRGVVGHPGRSTRDRCLIVLAWGIIAVLLLAESWSCLGGS